ncbi:hypothetical protein V1282_005689 [Nitrobacteraceae bacterium AZCC 2146]
MAAARDRPQLDTARAFGPKLSQPNGFKTFIVSGGGVEFMRAFAECVYGIAPYDADLAAIEQHRHEAVRMLEDVIGQCAEGALPACRLMETLFERLRNGHG